MATTWTIGTGQTYTTLSAWSTAVKAVGSGTLDDDYIGSMEVDEVYATANSNLNFSAVNLNGFTITLQAASGVKHDGDFGNGARIAEAKSGGGIFFAAQKCILLDLSIENTETTVGGARCFQGAAGFTMKRCIVKTNSSGANSICLDGSGTFNYILESCRFVGGVSGLLAGGASSGTIHNCTVSGASGTGVNLGVSTSMDVKNVLSHSNGTDFSYTTSGTSLNNASDDGTQQGTGSIQITGGDDFAADGYTPASGQQLDGAGTNLSITLDAANNTFANPPSIGAYEVVVADAVAPVLTVPSTTNATATTIDGTVSSDEGNGTIYGVVTTSGTAPSVVQIQAGQDSAGVAAAWSGSQAVSGTGTQTLSASATIVPGTTYYFHFQQEDAATNDSTVVSSASFALTALPTSAVYSGGTIPADSILHYAAGTSDSGSATTMVDAGLVASDDIYNGLTLRNDTDTTSVVIVDSVASTDTLTFLTGSVDFTSTDLYAITATLATSDVMYCEGTVTVTSEAVDIDWYIKDVAPSVAYSQVYTQTITGLTGVADGNYTTELSVLGVLTLTAEVVANTWGIGGNDYWASVFTRVAGEHLQDAEKRYLLAAGATTLQDNTAMWRELLEAAGYTGTVQEMKKKWIAAGLPGL